MRKTSISLLRGADTIGGSCIKITHGDASIILDYGMPLMASGGAQLDSEAAKKPSISNGILLDITSDGKPPLACIISHAHPDHYGLVDYLPENIPVYTSEAAKVLMAVGNVFFPPALQVNRLDSCLSFKPGKAFTIGPFTITAYLMDHSAFGACSLLVEVAGKTIFYTGDFRGHGRKTTVNDYVLNAVKQPDILLMEGTTLDDGHPATFPSEQSVEQALVELIQATKAPIFVAGSGSNVDRIVSLYRAAKRTGRILVVDLYQMYLLEQLQASYKGLPPHRDDHLRVFYPRSQCTTIVEKLGAEVLYRYQARQIKRDAIDYSSDKYIFRLSNSITKSLCKNFVEQNKAPELVYSMWQGYKEQQQSFSDIEALVGKPWIYIHTSGHAYTKALKELAEGLQAKKLIPIHTVKGEEFSQHFDNVYLMKNGEGLEL